MCGGKVYLLERHIDGSKLYHRHCIRTSQRSQSKPSSYTADLHPTNTAGQDGTPRGRLDCTGLFETQNKSRAAHGSNPAPEGGIDKSLSAGVSIQEKNVSSHIRSHPYSRQPVTGNKVDKIAELFNETEKSTSKATSSKSLLLAGYASTAYKPISVETSSVLSGTNSTVSKPSSGLKTVSTSETKPYVTTITSNKREVVKAAGNDTKVKSTISQGADTCVAVVGRPKTITQKGEGLEGPTVSNKDKPSDPAVVSGLLQSLAQVRNNDNKGNALISKSDKQPASNVKDVRSNKHNVQVVSRTTVNSDDKLSQGISKAGVNARSPVNPKCKYLQITKPQNVPNTSTAVSSQISPSSITQPSSRSISTVLTTKTTATVNINNTKPNNSDSTSHITPISIINKTPHTTISSTAQTQENMPTKSLYTVTMKETPTKQPKSVLKIRSVEPSKKKEEDLEIDWTTPDPTLKTSGHDISLSSKAVPIKSVLKTSETNDVPVAPPRKSILKKKEANKSQEMKSVQSNSSVITGISVSPRKDINTFNLTDSVEMSHGELTAVRSKNKVNGMQKVEIEIKGKEEKGKPEWMLEAEKRQKMRGWKYIDPEKKWKTDDSASKTTPTNKRSSEPLNVTIQATRVKQSDTGAKTNVNQRVEPSRNNRSTSPNGELNMRANVEKVRPGALDGDKRSASDNKPEWMKEAERRIEERNGKYIDPEKHLTRKTLSIRDGRTTSPGSSVPPRPVTSPQTSPKSPASPQSPRLQKVDVGSTGINNDVQSPTRKRQAPPRPDYLPPYTTPPPYSSDTSPGRRRLVPSPITLNSPLTSPEERLVGIGNNRGTIGCATCTVLLTLLYVNHNGSTIHLPQQKSQSKF